MNCERMRRRIQRYLDGENRSEKEHALVAFHLSECAGCRRYLYELSVMHDFISGIEPLTADGIPVARLMESIRKVRGGTGMKNRYSGKMINRFVTTAAALAAVLLLAVSVKTIRGDSVDPVLRYLLQPMGNNEVLHLTANE